MTTSNIYYHVYSSTMYPCSLVRNERERAFKVWQCKGCMSPKPDCKAIDVRLETPLRLDKPITFVSGSYASIVLKEILAPIDRTILERDIYFGRVIREGGLQLNIWGTFCGICLLIVRNTKNSGQRVCSECGQTIYSAMGKRHLFFQPPADADMFGSKNRMGFIVTERVFKMPDLAKWRRGFYIDELEVVDLRPESLMKPTLCRLAKIAHVAAPLQAKSRPSK